ncbi:MAG TPA: glutaredoxin domain-containing protein [Aquihabitans sp.]|nr:glutaredoxin domain-containing protein [Aquihabitans sp.]
MDERTAARRALADEPEHGGGDAEIVVYWRPGCGFCSSLRRQLDGAGVPHRLVDIWADRAAAEVVRSFARGNETVPTVVVGPVGLVNPGLHEVLAAAADHAPGAVPEGYEPPGPGRWSGRRR